MSGIFGSSPKVEQTSAPTINPQQQQLLNILTQAIQGGVGQVTQPGGGFISPAQTGIINALTGAAGSLPQPGTGVAQQAQGTLAQVLGSQAPQVVAPTATETSTVGTTPVNATDINAAQAFQTGVAQPIIQDFNTQVLPAMKAAQAGNAGGVYNSGAGLADQQADTNLARTLAQQGTLYDLGAQQANQTANLAASQSNAANTLSASNANASNQLATILANLQSQLGTNSLNVGAQLGQNQLLAGAAGEAPGVQYSPSSDFANVLTQLLTGASLPTNEANTLLGLGSGVSTAPTISNNTVVQSGQTGLLPGLLTSLAGSQGVGNAAGAGLGALFSDERVKEDIQPVGKLDNGLPVYTFRYKGDPLNVTRLGLIAQDVEKKRPEAVGEVGGVKTVNYALAALKARKVA